MNRSPLTVVCTPLLAAMALLQGCKKDKNQAPDGAAVPLGPKTAFKNTALGYRSSAADPDGDSVAIRFDWGDGDTSDWSGLVESDASVSDTHQWVLADTFEIRAQAKDGAGLSSDWSEPFAVAIIGGWAKTFGGTERDIGYSVQPTTDGGYILVGYTYSYGNGDGDVYLIKTDAFGNQTWTKTFGGTGGDGGNSVQQTSDGGYIVLGWTGSYGTGHQSFWLVKTDESGNQVWAQTFGGAGWSFGRSVQQTRDGGYILVGQTGIPLADSGDILLVKTDASGNQTWAKNLGGTGYEEGYSVQQTPEGGYIICGETESYGAGVEDVWLIRTDANGNVE